MFFLSKALSHPNMQLGIFGTLVESALGGFPEKPDVPQAPRLDLQSAQRRSTSGNLAALPGLENLGTQVDTYNLGARTKALNTAIPNYSRLTGAAGDTIGGWLSGALSPDVASQIQRNANARSFAGGYNGSGMADNLTARDLGLTSLDLQKMGVSALPSYLSTLYSIGVPPQYNIQSGLTTPGQQLGVDQFNETSRYSRDWLQNQLDALPDPETAAIAKDVGGIADLVGSAALAWAGGGLGGLAGGIGGSQLGSSVGAQAGGGSPSFSSLFSGIGTIGGGIF